MPNSEAKLGWNQDPKSLEGRPDVPVEIVDLQTTHGSSCACPLCGGRMLEVYSSNEIWGINIIIRTDNMPTYYCEEDDYAKSDLSALIEFHEGALQRILATGDQETATGLSQEIWAAKRVQELSPGSL